MNFINLIFFSERLTYIILPKITIRHPNELLSRWHFKSEKFVFFSGLVH